MRAVGEAIREALAETERCPLLLEDTAGAHRHRSAATSTSWRELVELGGGDERLGHLPRLLPPVRLGLRDPRRRRRSRDVVDEFDAKLGLERLRLPARQRLGDAARARTATATRTSARASSGARDSRAFLSEPRFEGLPALLETRGPTARGRIARR